MRPKIGFDPRFAFGELSVGTPELVQSLSKEVHIIRCYILTLYAYTKTVLL